MIRAFVLSAMYIMLAFWVSLLIRDTESDSRPDFPCQEHSGMDQNTSGKPGGIYEVIRAFALSALYIILAFWVSLLIRDTDSDTRPVFA